MVSRKYLILLSLSGFVVSLDQLTKNAVVNKFALGETLPVFDGVFNVTRVHNTGAAFGLLATLPPELRDPFFLVVPAFTLAIILGIFYKLSENQLLNVYALAAIVGGAIGNIADRIRLGYVVDFLDLHWNGQVHFPAFNVADMAISFGVALLLISMLYEREGDDPESQVA